MNRVSCPTCFYTAEWSASGEVLEVLQEGGGRQPSPHPTLAAWRIWARSRKGELGPVVGRCPQCQMPLVSADPEASELPASEPWTLDSPRGPVVVGAEVLTGPTGPFDDAAADAFFEAQFKPDPVAELVDLRLIFVVAMVGMLLLIVLFWLGAGLFVANFLHAMGTQGNFSAPSVP